jgi:hypothetical protein
LIRNCADGGGLVAVQGGYCLSGVGRDTQLIRVTAQIQKAHLTDKFRAVEVSVMLPGCVKEYSNSESATKKI